MKHLLSVLVAGLAFSATAALAQDKRDGVTTSDRDTVFVSATCEDLTVAARARHPACAPNRETARVVFEAAPVRVAEREVVSEREVTVPRRIVRIPWSIGVFQ